MATSVLLPELKSALSKVGLKEIDEATMSKCEFPFLATFHTIVSHSVNLFSY